MIRKSLLSEGCLSPCRATGSEDPSTQASVVRFCPGARTRGPRSQRVRAPRPSWFMDRLSFALVAALAAGSGLLAAGCGASDSGYQGECPESGCAIFGTAARFDVTSADFFSRPWPANARRLPDGRLDLTGFPNPAPSSMLRDAIELIGRDTAGFGTNQAIYVTFDGELDPASLPADPAASLRDGATVFLVRIPTRDGDPGLDRAPISVRYFSEERQFTPARTLVARPVLGFPLRPAARYALVVTRAVRDLAGERLGAWEAFERTKYAVAPKDEALRAYWEQHQPVFSHLERLGLARGEVAALAVFDTQDVLSEMERVRDFVAQMEAPAARDIQLRSTASDYWLFEGSVDLPQLQAGEPPDFTGGGGFVFDDQGRPVVQRVERAPFALAIPRASAPAAGFPVVLQAHGTGGDRFSHFDGANDPAPLLARAGIASIGLDQPLHGARNPWGRDESLITFNFYNILAMRDNFRQGAVDLLVLRRLVRNLCVPAAVSPSGAPLCLDGEKAAFFGHSQGGLTGPIWLGVAGDVAGAVLSGAGGGLGQAILEKTAPVNIRELVVLGFGLVDSELDLDHPALNLFQAFAERADPLNYAPRFLSGPPGGQPLSVYFSEGLLDEYCPPDQTEALATAAGCSLMQPVARAVPAMELAGRPALPPPVRGNATSTAGAPLTAVLVQYPQDGHFAVFQNATARSHYTQFLHSLFSDPPPSVGP